MSPTIFLIFFYFFIFFYFLSFFHFFYIFCFLFFYFFNVLVGSKKTINNKKLKFKKKTLLFKVYMFIDQIQIYTSICNKSLKIKSCISQYSFHFTSQSCFSISICHNLKSIQFGSALNKFNLCFLYTGYRNHRHGPAGL